MKVPRQRFAGMNERGRRRRSGTTLSPRVPGRRAEQPKSFSWYSPFLCSWVIDCNQQSLPHPPSWPVDVSMWRPMELTRPLSGNYRLLSRTWRATAAAMRERCVRPWVIPRPASPRKQHRIPRQRDRDHCRLQWLCGKFRGPPHNAPGAPGTRQARMNMGGNTPSLTSPSWE